MTDTQQKSNEVSDEDVEAALNTAYCCGFDDGNVLKGDKKRAEKCLKTVSRILKSIKSHRQPATNEPIKDATRDLLSDIISWEKDLSEYMSLETILKEKYKITKR